MTKERVLELGSTQIRNIQDNTPKDASKEDLLYLMAYNDATLNPKVCEILTNILTDIFEYDDTDAIKVKYMRQIIKYYEENKVWIKFM